MDIWNVLRHKVEKDSGSEEAVAYIIQSGLGLPDEAYYREEAHAETLVQVVSTEGLDGVGAPVTFWVEKDSACASSR